MSKYNRSITDPMKQELIDNGVEDLVSFEAVDAFLKNDIRSSVLFINSVCGCSARVARPAFIKSLQHRVFPDRVGTVFAGVDEEATHQARKYITGYPPSSPAIVFFREGESVYMLERKHIEGFDADSVTQSIIRGYDKFVGLEVDEKVELKAPSQLLEKTVWEVKKDLDKDKIILLDCRQPEEKDIATISGSQLITQELADEIVKKWDRKQEIVIFCHYGDRSLQAVLHFKKYGFESCYSMSGGIESWAREIDKSIPSY